MLIRRVVVLLAVIVSAWALSAPAATSAGGARGCFTEVITLDSGVGVEVKGLCYEPTVLRVDVGETVSWTNRDRVLHTVSGVNDGWGDYETFGLAETVSFTFDQAGTYPYVCALHPLMVGAVVVGDGGTLVQPNVATDDSELPPFRGARSASSRASP